MNYLNDINPYTNGEEKFLNSIKENIEVVFDIGCRNDSLFINLPCDVHYFEPINHFLSDLKKQKNHNKNSYFNNFGLSDEEGVFPYYQQFQSFLDRRITFKNSNSPKINLELKKSSDYIEENNIKQIDFVKIDTEGFELKVLKGFGNKIKIVKQIQFEYGGTFQDANIKLLDIINYLLMFGFEDFSYLYKEGLIKIDNFEDHYQYCNIVCFNKTLK